MTDTVDLQSVAGQVWYKICDIHIRTVQSWSTVYWLKAITSHTIRMILLHDVGVLTLQYQEGSVAAPWKM